jgi:hypothetical protein
MSRGASPKACRGFPCEASQLPGSESEEERHVDEEPQRFSVIWQTAVACVVSLIVFVLVLYIVNAFVVMVGLLPTEDGEDRSLSVNFGRAIAPSLFGVAFARIACDKLFQFYSRRAVAIFFVLISVPSIAPAFRSNLGPLPRIFAAIAGCSILVAAFYAFWKNKKADLG